MTKLMSVRDCDFNFYECIEGQHFDSVADYYETLKIHFKRRGELMRDKDKKFWELMAEWRKDRERLNKLLKNKIMHILLQHPRSDNYSVGGRLVSANSVIEQELTDLIDKSITF